MVLAFGTRTTPPPDKDTLAMLSGVIASSPLLLQTFPASKIARFAGGKLSGVFPGLLIDALVLVVVSICARTLRDVDGATDTRRTGPFTRPSFE